MMCYAIEDIIYRDLLQQTGKHRQLLNLQSTSLAGHSDHLHLDPVDTSDEGGVVNLLPVSPSRQEVASSAHESDAIDSDKRLVLPLHEKTL